MSQAGEINVRNQATISMIGNFADTAISFGGLVAMAYILGAAGLGQYTLILSVVSVALFPVIGVGRATLKRVSESGHDPDTVFGTSLTVCLLYFAVCVVLLFSILTLTEVDIRFGRPVIAATTVVFVVRGIFTVQLEAYRGYGHPGYATWMDNAYGIFQTALQVIVLFKGYGILGLLAATAVSTTTVAVLHYTFSNVQVGYPSMEALEPLRSYSLWSVPSVAVSRVYTKLPILVLGAVGADAAIGYYKSADKLLILGSYVASSLAPALMAKTSANMDSVPIRELFEELYSVLHHATLLSVALLFGALSLSEPLMRIFFDMTDPAASVALILLGFYHVINTISNVEFSFLSGLDHPEYATKGEFIALIVQVLCILLLFPNLGFTGVVLSIMLAHFSTLVFAQYVFRTRYDIYVWPKGVPLQVVSAAVMFLVVEYFSTAFETITPVRLGGVVAVGGVVYVTVLLIIDSAFRDIVESIAIQSISFVRTSL